MLNISELKWDFQTADTKFWVAIWGLGTGGGKLIRCTSQIHHLSFSGSFLGLPTENVSCWSSSYSTFRNIDWKPYYINEKKIPFSCSNLTFFIIIFYYVRQEIIQLKKCKIYFSLSVLDKTHGSLKRNPFKNLRDEYWRRTGSKLHSRP